MALPLLVGGMDWYLAVSGEPKGPFSEEQLRTLATGGELADQTLAWNADLENWTPLAVALPHLFKPVVTEPMVRREVNLPIRPAPNEATVYPRVQAGSVWPAVVVALLLHAGLFCAGWILRHDVAPLIELAAPETALQIEEVPPAPAETPMQETPPAPAPPEPVAPPEPAPTLSEPLPAPITPPEFTETIPTPPPLPLPEPVAPPSNTPAPMITASAALPPQPTVPVATTIPPVTTVPLTASAPISGPIEAQPSDYLSAPRASYPYEARKRRQEGTVVLLVHFDDDGHPVHVEVQQSSGTALLDATARLHVQRSYRFKPGTSHTVLVPMTFSLANN